MKTTTIIRLKSRFNALLAERLLSIFRESENAKAEIQVYDIISLQLFSKMIQTHPESDYKNGEYNSFLHTQSASLLKLADDNKIDVADLVKKYADAYNTLRVIESVEMDLSEVKNTLISELESFTLSDNDIGKQTHILSEQVRQFNNHVVKQTTT